MAMSNYLSNALANAVVRNVSYTSPANVYVALYSTAPTVSTAGTELTGNGYSRQNVTFSAPSSGAANSNVAVTFGPATGNAWPAAIAMSVTDASTGGNILYFKSISPQIVDVGDSLTLSSGNITVTMS